MDVREVMLPIRPDREPTASRRRGVIIVARSLSFSLRSGQIGRITFTFCFFVEIQGRMGSTPGPFLLNYPSRIKIPNSNPIVVRGADYSGVVKSDAVHIVFVSF